MVHPTTNRLLISISLLGLLAISLNSCYKDNEEDLYGTDNCVTTNVSFNTQVQPVLNANCVSCHSGAGASAGIRLSNHTEVSAAIDGGRFVGAIKHQSGFSAMPPSGPKLTNCQISQIEAWIAQGKPNN
ncbi:MAG TPA: cytochrome c [Bacteroidales bacterium]|nr:cytochrome c [Bacteroidales bacterium]